MAGFAGIAPIAPITTGAGAGSIMETGVSAGSAATGAEAPGGLDFVSMLNNVSAMETQAGTAAVNVATNGGMDVATYTTLAARAQLAVELTAAVRNRAVDAFGEIMRMQV